jgi:hypothetical protein
MLRTRINRALGWILRGPIAIVVALYFLFDDLVLGTLRPFFRWLASLRIIARIEQALRGLSPTVSLLVFAVPFAILEPPKLVAIYLMAVGHVRTGTILLISAHLASIIFVERLFHVTRDKLLTIGWFAAAHGWVVAVRDRALIVARRTAVWRAAVRLSGIVHQAARAAVKNAKRSIEWVRQVVKEYWSL